MNKGISNFQINDFFRDEENEDLKIYIWELIQQIQEINISIFMK